MFDSGGSSGKLRKELGILPLGDVRQCLIALSNENNLTNLFHYRFEKGALKGHNFGNLLIAAAIGVTGGLKGAIEKIAKILNIKDKVVPVTLERADIIALLKNNKKIREEEKIINYPYLSRIGVKKLFLEPEVKANPEAISAIKKADLIIITPGKFYTSILPIFLVKGISEAVRKSRAKKIFVCNLMTQIGNTDGFSVEDFLTILEKYLGEEDKSSSSPFVNAQVGKDIIDYVIFNIGKLSPQKLREVKKAFPEADFIKYDEILLKKKNFIGTDLLNKNIRKLNPTDVLVKGANKRTMILHNPNKLAKIIISLI